MKLHRLFAVLFFLALFVIGTHIARADQVILQDPTNSFGIGTMPNPCFSNDPVWGCAFGPEFASYSVGTPFTISKITISWQNSGSNNCDGMGNAIAVITSANTMDSIVATSTDSIYMGCASQNGQHGGGEFDFPAGTVVPQNFYLSITSPDGVQGGSGIGVQNITIYGSPDPVLEPVVIIPGVMGSVLERASDGAEVWPSVLKMLLPGPDEYLNDLKLFPNGAETTPLATGDVIREELFVFPFYQPLIAALETAGYKENSTLFVAPYDWRMSMASSAAEIAPVFARAASVSPNGKINVIAHSMGGLVMKEYLESLAPATSPVDKLILAGVPQLGAPRAFKLLLYGDDLGLSFLGLGLDQGEASAIAQNMPGVYDILPSRRYIDVNGGYFQDFTAGRDAVLDYDDTGALTSNAAMLSAADALHGALDNDQFDLASSSIYSIMGCKTDTLGGIKAYDDDDFDISWVNGDGTVPLTSAFDLQGGYHNFFVPGGEHAGLVEDASSLALIVNILNGPPEVHVPEDISGSLSDCLTSQPDEFLVSANGSVNLDVTDDAGDETGPNDASGTIATGIPSSSYEAIGNSKFVVLPADRHYKITAQATASGTLDMKTATVKNSVTKKKTTYLAVKLPKPGAKARLDIAPSSTDAALVVDSNDPAIPEVAYDPTATLDDASSSADSEPPILFMPALPESAALNSTTTFVFSATDSGSGIAWIEGTLNGKEVMSGQSVTLDEAGENIFLLEAEDNAGNPALRSGTFTVLGGSSMDPSRSCISS